MRHSHQCHRSVYRLAKSAEVMGAAEQQACNAIALKEIICSFWHAKLASASKSTDECTKSGDGAADVDLCMASMVCPNLESAKPRCGATRHVCVDYETRELLSVCLSLSLSL